MEDMVRVYSKIKGFEQINVVNEKRFQLLQERIIRVRQMVETNGKRVIEMEPIEQTYTATIQAANTAETINHQDYLAYATNQGKVSERLKKRRKYNSSGSSRPSISGGPHGNLTQMSFTSGWGDHNPSLILDKRHQS